MNTGSSTKAAELWCVLFPAGSTFAIVKNLGALDTDAGDRILSGERRSYKKIERLQDLFCFSESLKVAYLLREKEACVHHRQFLLSKNGFNTCSRST